MFVDYCKIEIKAGNGGNGCISFRHEKYISKGGPDGGNGGNGGSIFLKVNKNINSLNIFRKTKIFIAENGENGSSKNCHGHNGKDMVIEVPIGTVIYDEITKELLFDLNENNQKIVIANGGKGGKGNAAFKNAKNRAPYIAEKGNLGEIKKIILELKLIADICLIGLPNAGKSTILSVISNAKPKIDSYPFTTINPCLGVVNYKNNFFIVADIPGLIKDAHKGKGLGLQFLRHIERCKIIAHVISMENEINDLINNYKIINNELKEYNKKLLKKQTLIVASKMDIDNAQNKKKIFEKKIKKKIFSICAITHLGIDFFLNECLQQLQKYKEKNKINKITTKEKIYNAKKNDNENKYNILHLKKNEWYINTNVKIMHNYIRSKNENIQYILKYLNNTGINDELKKMGIKNGDNVFLDDFVFEYVEK